MTDLEDALDRVLARVDSTEAAVGRRFPIHADPESGVWLTSRRGSWVAGFWAGQLWLRARLSGRAEHVCAAREAAERLVPAAGLDTATRGLILWYGAAAGERLGLSRDPDPTSGPGSGHPCAAARSAAESLCATVEAESGILPWGTAFGDPPDPVTARVDGLAGTVPLLAWAGRAPAAEACLRGYLDLASLRADPATPPDATAGQAFPGTAACAFERVHGGWRARPSPPPGWSRGQAWLLLALADAGYWLSPEFADQARSWLDSAPQLRTVPPAIAGHGGTVDTSAAAITAVALAKLGRLGAARDLVTELVGDHLATSGPPGRLLRGCYDLPGGVATEHELIWGNYFLLLALAVVLGTVPPTLV